MKEDLLILLASLESPQLIECLIHFHGQPASGEIVVATIRDGSIPFFLRIPAFASYQGDFGHGWSSLILVVFAIADAPASADGANFAPKSRTFDS